MALANLKVIAPTTILRKVMPRRLSNSAYRTREYLTPEEIDRLLKATKGNRHAHRDYCLILTCYRHSLRVSELVRLRWQDVDLHAGRMFIKRLKNSLDSTHPISGVEMRALRKLKQKAPKDSPWVFLSERGAPMTRGNVQAIVAKAGRVAGFDFKVHPHQLRHSTGFYLSEKGVPTRSLAGFMGHKNLNNTAIYTALSPHHFKDWWED